MFKRNFHHMTYVQRSQMQTMLSMEKTQREIALEIGVSQSSISREIVRNSRSYRYDFRFAHEESVKRRSCASEIPKKMKGALKARVLNGLEQDWSPEQISGRLKLEGISVSHETIYKYAHRDKVLGGSLYEHLRHGGRKYRRRVGKSAGVRCIPNRVDIAERPAIVDQKLRLGDWEGDAVVSTESRAHLVTLVDRCSKFLIVRKIGKKPWKIPIEPSLTH